MTCEAQKGRGFQHVREGEGCAYSCSAESLQTTWAITAACASGAALPLPNVLKPPPLLRLASASLAGVHVDEQGVQHLAHVFDFGDAAVRGNVAHVARFRDDVEMRVIRVTLVLQ